MQTHQIKACRFALYQLRLIRLKIEFDGVLTANLKMDIHLHGGIDAQHSVVWNE